MLHRRTDGRQDGTGRDRQTDRQTYANLNVGCSQHVQLHAIHLHGKDGSNPLKNGEMRTA